MTMWKIIIGEYSTYGDVVIMRMQKIIFGEYSTYGDKVIMRMQKIIFGEYSTYGKITGPNHLQGNRFLHRRCICHRSGPHLYNLQFALLVYISLP
jgi:hypothetical protein